MSDREDDSEGAKPVSALSTSRPNDSSISLSKINYRPPIDNSIPSSDSAVSKGHEGISDTHGNSEDFNQSQNSVSNSNSSTIPEIKYRPLRSISTNSVAPSTSDKKGTVFSFLILFCHSKKMIKIKLAKIILEILRIMMRLTQIIVKKLKQEARALTNDVSFVE